MKLLLPKSLKIIILTDLFVTKLLNQAICLKRNRIDTYRIDTREPTVSVQILRLDRAVEVGTTSVAKL